MTEYRKNPVYQTLEKIINDAGVRIIYQNVPDDSIDGEIWARSDHDGMSIMMPDEDTFPDVETACLILGHEMGHILTGLDSPDEPVQRRINEATCDQVGAYLYNLAGLTWEESQRRLFESAKK